MILSFSNGSIFEYQLKDKENFELSAHSELKITFRSIIFEPILGFITSSIRSTLRSLCTFRSKKHQTSSVPPLFIIVFHIAAHAV